MAPRGTPEETRTEAAKVVARLDPARVLWVDGHGASEADGVKVEARLGHSFDAVVIDLHGGCDPEVLGICHGFVRGGGALVLRMQPEGELPRDLRVRLAVPPYPTEAVGLGFQRRFARLVAASAEPSRVLAPSGFVEVGTPDQRVVVEALIRRWSKEAPSWTVLVADRGRGKSAALGLALRAVAKGAWVTAAEATQTDEVRGFGAVPFVALEALLEGAMSEDPGRCADIIVIDEAAALPVPVLKQLVLAYPRAHFAWATTVRGYEGTGRGFALRFLPWLEARARESEIQADAERARDSETMGSERLVTLTMKAPIRWAEDDPLEDFVFRALALDAEPVALPVALVDEEGGAPLARVEPGGTSVATMEVSTLERERLAEPAGETDLRDLFGLLVHAHYRTTPSDLWRMIDAPNLAVHAVRSGGRVIATSLVAREGGLDATQCEAIHRGQGRVRAHAMADALVAHLGHRDAGQLRMIRSVRVATHPELRRAGLGRTLVEHVHATYHDEVDLFGTLFGATPELLAFRHSLGYRVVRVSASRGARTGEPSVLMLRPVTGRAELLFATLRAELARDLATQLSLLEAELVLDPALRAALSFELPPPATFDAASALATTRDYVNSPRTFESVALAVRLTLEAHPATLDALPAPLRALLTARALEGRTWAEARRRSGLPSIAAAMRAMRRAVRAVLDGLPPTRETA